MKKINLMISILVLLTFSFWGCKKETTAPIETIPSNLFPLRVGNVWYYSGYEIDTAGAKISGTDFTSSTTIVRQEQFQGKNSFVVIDSFKYADRRVEIDTLFVYFEGNYLYAWIDLSVPDIRFTYKRWVPFIKTGGNLNEPYTILNLDTTIMVSFQGQQLPLNIKANITGNISKKEEVQTPAGKFVSYKFEAIMTSSVSVGGVVVQTSSSRDYIWLSPGIGPIKHETPASGNERGVRRELTGYRVS
ncbi:MAG: hypothetical protein RMJ81_09720 [Candidatus Kryptonium sp.]|nr:hypothetical protein [Candidatus Kryptonium sp.]MCX7763021.1 hypothetical protein [Candidatus Kryptonium sp.]MDW8109912.1 hypothetical protein [Candidatus Kryptonium sp.]